MLSPIAPPCTIGRTPQREIYAITMNRTIKKDYYYDEINYESVAIKVLKISKLISIIS